MGRQAVGPFPAIVRLPPLYRAPLAYNLTYDPTSNLHGRPNYSNTLTLVPTTLLAAYSPTTPPFTRTIHTTNLHTTPPQSCGSTPRLNSTITISGPHHSSQNNPETWSQLADTIKNLHTDALSALHTLVLLLITYYSRIIEANPRIPQSSLQPYIQTEHHSGDRQTYFLPLPPVPSERSEPWYRALARRGSSNPLICNGEMQR